MTDPIKNLKDLRQGSKANPVVVSVKNHAKRHLGKELENSPIANSLKHAERHISR